MKRVEKVLGSLLAVALMMFALNASAAEAQMGGRDFNHLVTGFPLTGGHAMTPCETCHLGGVFKGTPKTCEGCHALGKRIVATPKSTGHIVTDAPCETCHFNNSTFLGAKFNHGTAMKGQCMSCHNGRQSTPRPANHTSVAQVANSCDQCHRTYAWFPASWNHVGVIPGTCATAGCHLAGSNQYFRGPSHTAYGTGYACDDCHSYTSWRPAPYKHTGAGGSNVCLTCHNGSTAETTPAGHVAIGADDCNQCHTSKTTWLGALGAKPANHIPYNAGVSCTSCHTGTTVVTGATLHAYVSGTCKTCHNSSPVYLGSMTRKTLGNHEKSTTSQDCISCHARQFNRWNNP